MSIKSAFVDNIVVALSILAFLGLGAVFAEASTHPTGEKSILVVPVLYNYIDDNGNEQTAPWDTTFCNLDPNSIRQTLDTVVHRFVDSLPEVSNGKLSATFDIHPTLERIPYDPIASPPLINKIYSYSEVPLSYSEQYVAILESWMAFIDRQNIDTSDYDHVMIVAGSGMAGDGGALLGVAESGSPWAPKKFLAVMECHNNPAMQHEFFHNYGLNHSVSEDTTMDDIKGGFMGIDWADLMGYVPWTFGGDLSIMDKIYLGFADLNDQFRLQFVGSPSEDLSQTYVIKASDVDPGTLGSNKQQALYIPINGNLLTHLEASFRVEDGLASKHFSTYTYRNYSPLVYIKEVSQTWYNESEGLLNPAPKYTQRRLAPGESYKFTANGVDRYVNFAGFAGTSAFLKVSDCQSSSPDIVATPSVQSGEVGDELVYQVSVKNNNPKAKDGGCDKSDFVVKIDDLPSGFSSEPLNIIGVRSGATKSQNVTLSISDSSATTSNLRIRATEVKSGFFNRADVQVMVQSSEPDVTPPTPPSDLGVSNGKGKNKNNVTITWSPAIDLGSGVDYYNIYCNIAGNFSTTETSYQLIDPVSGQSCYVTAVDNAGNESVASPLILIP